MADMTDKEGLAVWRLYRVLLQDAGSLQLVLDGHVHDRDRVVGIGMPLTKKVGVEAPAQRGVALHVHEDLRILGVEVGHAARGPPS